MPAKNAYFIARFLLLSQPQAPRFSFDWPEENDSQEPDVWTLSEDVSLLSNTLFRYSKVKLDFQGPAINDLQTFPRSHNRLLYMAHQTRYGKLKSFLGGWGCCPCLSTQSTCAMLPIAGDSEGWGVHLGGGRFMAEKGIRMDQISLESLTVTKRHWEDVTRGKWLGAGTLVARAPTSTYWLSVICLNSVWPNERQLCVSASYCRISRVHSIYRESFFATRVTLWIWSNMVIGCQLSLACTITDPSSQLVA